jgi:two-component system, chemotaxis family, sensor kinase CheA
MDLSRFRDLYVAETQEQLERLDRALIALERDGSELEEAFRAAHTLKSLAATMEQNAVAALAHRLEDRLDALRRSGVGGAIDVDELFALRDRLAAQAEAFDGAPEAPRDEASGPLAVRVRLRADAPIKAARALLVTRAAAEAAPLLAVEPAEPDESFDGELVLFVDRATDRSALERAVRSAGDVEDVEFGVAAAVAGGATAADAAGGHTTVRVQEPPPPLRRRQLRVEQARLDGLAETVAELAVLQGRLTASGRVADASITGMIDRMHRLVADLQVEILALRMVPMADVLDRVPRQVRDIGRQLGKEVDLHIGGSDVRLDRAILDEIGEPLVHLVRNALAHGIETPDERLAAGKPRRGVLSIKVEGDRSSVRLELRDDGAGADVERIEKRAREIGILESGETLAPEDLLRVLSHSGFSTLEHVNDIAGRGVGLDVVVAKVRALGGAIDMHSEQGAGTVFTIRLPTTLALANALRVLIGGEEYAIPVTHVMEAVDFADIAPELADGREVLPLRGESVPVVRLGGVLGVARPGCEQAAVLTGIGDRRAALAVDRVVGHEQILVKPFDAAVGTLPVFSGVTMLADGRPALVLDPVSVL